MASIDPRFPHTAAGDGVAYAILGETITFKVTTAASGGALLAVEVTSPPGGGPPLHTHPSAEVFLILAGAFAFHGLERGKPYAIQATPGDVVAIPGAAPHTYQTVSPTPGQALAILTPGDELERFFAEAGTMVDASAPLAAKRVPSGGDRAHGRHRR